MDTSSKSERRFQREIERRTGIVFKKVRPDWLKNPLTHECMELDMYDDDRKLAIEYNGIQHYDFPNPFHKSLQEFVAQQQRDAAKATICRERGVALISVKASNIYAEVKYAIDEMKKVCLGLNEDMRTADENTARAVLRDCLLWSGRSGGLEDVYDVLYEYDKVTTTLKWTFNQGDGKETSTFELNTTTLKARLQLCDNAEEIFVHGEKGLPVLTELAGVHQGIGQGLSWTVTRPTDDLMSFASTNRKIDVYNMDTPKNSTAILSWPLTPGMKSVNLKKSVIPTLKHAHDKAVKDAAMSRFGLDRLVIIGNNNNILIVNNKAADDDKKRTIDRAFYPVLKEGGVLDDLVAISDDRFYVWSSSTGLWNAGSINMAACHIRAAAADEDTVLPALNETVDNSSI